MLFLSFAVSFLKKIERGKKDWNRATTLNPGRDVVWRRQ